MKSKYLATSEKKESKWKIVPLEARSKAQRRLTPRDLVILMHIFRHRLATIPQLHKQVWGQEKKLCNMYHRLKILRNMGLLKKRPIITPGDVIQAYELTPKSIAAVLQSMRLNQKGQVLSQATLHDMHLADISGAIERLDLCKKLWTETEVLHEVSRPENKILKSPMQHKSDAFCIFKGKPEDIYCAIEYERTRKSAQRSLDRMYYYQEDPKIDWVLHITETQEDLHFLMDLDKQNYRLEQSKAFFCMRPELLDQKEGRTIFYRSNYSEIVLK